MKKIDLRGSSLDQSLPWNISINAECILDIENPSDLTSEVNALLESFHTQLLIALAGLEKQKDPNERRSLRAVLGKWLHKLFPKATKPKILLERIRENCERIIEVAKELEKPIPAIFANLIMNTHDPNRWTRIFSIGIRPSRKEWEETTLFIDSRIQSKIPHRVKEIFDNQD